MIIITLFNDYKIKYKGKITLNIDEEFSDLLWVTAQHSEERLTHTWHGDTWDNICLKDIKSIRGERNEH